MQHHLNERRFQKRRRSGALYYLSDTCVHWPDTSCSRTTPTEHSVLHSGRKTHIFLLKEAKNRESPAAAHHMGGVSLRHVSAVSSCRFSAGTLGLAETQHVPFTAQKLNVYPFKTNFKRYYGISEVGLYTILANWKYISCFSLKASDLLWLTYLLLIRTPYNRCSNIAEYTTEELVAICRHCDGARWL